MERTHMINLGTGKWNTESVILTVAMKVLLTVSFETLVRPIGRRIQNRGFRSILQVLHMF